MTAEKISKQEALHHILLFHHGASNVAEQASKDRVKTGLTPQQRAYHDSMLKNGAIRMTVLNWIVRHFDEVYASMEAEAGDEPLQL